MKRTLPLDVGGAFHSPLMEMDHLEQAKVIDIEPVSLSVPHALERGFYIAY